MMWAIVFDYYETKEEAQERANDLIEETGYDFQVIPIFPINLREVEKEDED